MDYATTDLVLAIVHHLLVFMLAGVLAFEIGTVTLTMKRDEILGVGRVDNWYGILALVIVVVGFIRATVAAKGWAYYEVILLGEDRHLRRRRPALNCPNGRDNSLAQCAEKRCRFCSAGGRNPSRPRLPLGESGPLPLAPGVRRRLARGYGELTTVIP